jgi:hypothetical protein
MGWATFWATFSQTHLVTLLGGYLQFGFAISFRFFSAFLASKF